MKPDHMVVFIYKARASAEKKNNAASFFTTFLYFTIKTISSATCLKIILSNS